MISEPLTNSHKIVQAVTIANGTAATTDISGAIIDMTDFEHVTFIVMLGPIVQGCALSMKVERGDAANLSDAEDMLGTALTIADDQDNKVKTMTVLRPGKRYVRLMMPRATQAATVAAIAILYGAHQKPVTQPADVLGEIHKDGGAGTA